MAGLQFDNGVKEFDVNGKATIRFNPLDTAFFQKVVALFEKCENLTKNSDNTPEGIQILDQKIKSEINAVFGDISAIFDGVSSVAIAGGLPVWANFIIAVIDEIDETIKKPIEYSPKVQKYLDKYKK